jgi:hypothetical protein
VQFNVSTTKPNHSMTTMKTKYPFHSTRTPRATALLVAAATLGLLTLSEVQGAQAKNIPVTVTFDDQPGDRLASDGQGIRGWGGEAETTVSRRSSTRPPGV